MSKAKLNKPKEKDCMPKESLTNLHVLWSWSKKEFSSTLPQNCACKGFSYLQVEYSLSSLHVAYFVHNQFFSNIFTGNILSDLHTRITVTWQVVQLENHRSILNFCSLYQTHSPNYKTGFIFSLGRQEPSKAQIRLLVSWSFPYTKTVHCFSLKNLL